MSGVCWYARNGDEITVEQWSVLHEDLEYIRVAMDHDGRRRVSTAWIGLAQYPFTDPPLIFETMIFGAADDPADQTYWRYASEAAALAGHAWVCATYLGRAAYLSKRPSR